MNISFLKCHNFTGHAAGRIKALYMQNTGNSSQLNLYNQVRQIGIKEGFDVIMHAKDGLKNENLYETDLSYNPWGVWSQDNKFFLSRNGKTTIFYPQASYDWMKDEVQSIAQQLDYPLQETQTYIDGGAVFFGKKNNGEKYALISDWNIDYCAAYQYIKSKNLQDIDNKLLDNFYRSKSVCFVKDIALRWDEFESNIELYRYKALEVISSEYDIELCNIIPLPDCEYHLDLIMRPLDYPYVLVNDDEKVDELIEKCRVKFSDDFVLKTMLEELVAKIQRNRKKFCSSDELCKKLQQEGFIPIKIAGTFGRSSINFMNAIVHQADDGLVYITNSAYVDNPLYQFIQNDFEENLHRLCPQIKRIHYVSGNKAEKDLNDIMIYLKGYNGGIHCLCSEEMME
ncbi:MAG: hypothetical protein IKU37_05225 [Candidatus Gastranaerophilales bacterium]|nr:hypothetical protein [Candidatus Gastranaerophilales bacterium]